jgi:hypothetical protein
MNPSHPPHLHTANTRLSSSLTCLPYYLHDILAPNDARSSLTSATRVSASGLLEPGCFHHGQKPRCVRGRAVRSCQTTPSEPGQRAATLRSRAPLVRERGLLTIAWPIHSVSFPTYLLLQARSPVALSSGAPSGVQRSSHGRSSLTQGRAASSRASRLSLSDPSASGRTAGGEAGPQMVDKQESTERERHCISTCHSTHSHSHHPPVASP